MARSVPGRLDPEPNEPPARENISNHFPGGWLVGFLVEKIISGLVYYSGEQSTVEDCLALLQACAKNSRM